MPPEKKRVELPKDLEANILFLNDHCCCICHKGFTEGHHIQIHHINSNKSDNRPENLAVLCNACHERLQDKLFMAQRLDPEELVKYKELWEKAVSEKRRHLQYPSARIKEKVIERFDEKGVMIERNIEREIYYAEGIVPQIRFN